jgi:hypothetical protein
LSSAIKEYTLIRFLKHLTVMLMLLATPVVHSVALVNTGPGALYSGGYSLTSSWWHAGKFSVNRSDTITDVEGWIGGGVGTGTIALYADNAGAVGAELFSTAFAVSGYIDPWGPTANAWAGASDLSWSVDAGTYWIAFEVRPGDTLAAWMPWGAPSPLTEYATTFSGDWVTWDTGDLGIRIESVPEPASIALVGVALLSAFATRRRI